MKTTKMHGEKVKRESQTLRRVLKALGFVGLGVLGLVIVLLVLLLIAPVRNQILMYALPRITGSLPGTLSVSDADWPRLNALHFEGVSWEADSVTVLSADTLAVSVRLLPLLRNDIEAHYLVAHGLNADIPGIRALFASTDSLSPGHSILPESDDEAGKEGFPRNGSVPGLPSIAIDSLSLTALAIKLSPESRIEDLILGAGVDLSHGGAPGLSINRLTLHGGGKDWRIDDLRIVLNIGEGIMEGRGTGALSADLPFHLEIEPGGRDEFVIALGKEAGALPPEEPGVRAAIKIERDGRRIVAAAYDIDVLTPGTEELREVPAIAGRIKSLPPTKGVSLAVKGWARFDPELDVRVRISVQEPEWLDRGVAVARYRKETLHLDSLLVSLIDLDLFAEGYFSPDSAVASAEIRAAGSEGLRVIAPGSGIPDSLDVWLRASVDADLEDRYLDGMLDARGKIGGLDLDTFNLTAGISLDEERTSSVRLSASTEGLVISTAAEIDRRDDILVRLEPINIRGALSADSPHGAGLDRNVQDRASQPKTGAVTYARESGDIRVENLEIVGALGDLKLDGYLSGEGTGRFNLACTWQEPPLPLMAQIGDSLKLVEIFREAWALDAPYSLEAEGTIRSERGTIRSEKGTIQPGENGRMLEASAEFTLPGPRTFALLLPEGARVGALGPVVGSIDFRSESIDTLTGFDLVLDVGRTEWVDSSVVHLTGVGSAISVDSLMLRAARLRLDFKGEYDLDTQAGHGELTLSDSGFVRRIYPAAPDVDLLAAGRFTGGESQEAEVSIEASIRGDGYKVPALECSLRSDRTGTHAAVRLPAGLTSGGLHLEVLEVDYTTGESGGELFPAAVSINASGGDFSLSQEVLLDVGDSVTCTVNAMNLSMSGRDLAADHPFTVVFDRGNQAISLEGVNLEGTLGRINADGFAGMDSVNVEAFVDLDLPPSPPPALAIPEVLWPDSVMARIRAVDRHDIEAEIAVSGFLLDDGGKGALRLVAKAAAGDIHADVVLADGLGEILRGNASLPGSLSVYPPSIELSGGDFQAEVDLDRFPVAVKKSAEGFTEAPDLVARIGGEAVLAGPVSGPGGYADLTVTFPGWPEMSDFRVVVEALLESETSPDEPAESRGGDLTDWVGENLGIDRTESLVGSVRMLRGAGSVLDMYLSYPLHLSFHPYDMGADSSRAVHAAITSRAIPLEEIDLLTPVGVGLDGTCAVDFSVAGPAGDPALSGSLEAKDLKIEIANLVQALLSGNAQFAGTARRPSISGDFTVESGVVTVPEAQPELHPVEGEAILLDPATLGLAPADSTRGLAMGSPGFEADYDIRIDIPSSFWLRGEGLEIELRGALEITQKDGLPVIVGDLNAQRGTYLFLGRVFDLERGIVNFYGTGEINPSLDISLASSIESNRIWINLTGDLVEPRLELVSDPEMTDGDIMATILFGKPLNELNDGQGNMLRDRMTDVLMAMGAAKLQQEVAGQYGIDLVTIRSGRDDDEENALVVGKYLTPKLLVMYEQGLREQSTSYIVMEYLLHRNLRVETLYGNDGRSSAGISLQKDY